ncbi:hypothetical protein PVL29_016202 [Vitis rotundifolia]|uniref:Uncharacterized protein n=1 Tax=Vitis rotundifolia TaxID=103349 RepID=A0AA39DMP4_VITRO|nr:hypothetical protein PVL29_016202 [Vitis rotundifolia]
MLLLSDEQYVLRDTAKNTSAKDKSTFILVPKRDDQLLSDKSHLQQQNVTSPVKNILGANAPKQNQRREGSGRIIRSILLNKDARQSQSSMFQSEQQFQASNLEKEKRPPRPPHIQLASKETNGAQDDKGVGNDVHSFVSEKQDKRTRNKDRPDRGVWTPLRRSDGSHASDESLSSSASQPTSSDFPEGSHGEMRSDMSNARSGEVKALGSGRGGHSALDNGSHKHSGRRGPTHSVKDADGSSIVSEGKHSKRGGAPGYGSHEVEPADRMDRSLYWAVIRIKPQPNGSKSPIHSHGWMTSVGGSVK